MVCKELKMNFNAAFVHNYPFVHTCFIGVSFSLPALSSRLRNILGITLFFQRRKNEGFGDKKRAFPLVTTASEG